MAFAVEVRRQAVPVQHLEVVGLAKRVDAQLPVHALVVSVAADGHQLVEARGVQFIPESSHQLIPLEPALGLRVNPQQAVSFDCRQCDQAVAVTVDRTEVVFLRHCREASVVGIGPAVKGAGEAGALAAGFCLDHHATVSANVGEGAEGGVRISGISFAPQVILR